MAKTKSITKITADDFSSKARRSRIIRIVIIGLLFAITAFALAIGAFVWGSAARELGDLSAVNQSRWTTIVAGLFGVGILALSIFILSGLKEVEEVLPWVTTLEKRYGGLEKTIQYIQQQLANGKPSSTVTEGSVLAFVTNNPNHETSFTIVGEWWLANIHDLDELEIINMHDIVTIVGNLDMGTMILVNDQVNAPRVVPAMFGRNRCGEVFNLFTAVNSHILDQDTEITMSDGSISSIYDLVTKGQTVMFGRHIAKEESKEWYKLIVDRYNEQI